MTMCDYGIGHRATRTCEAAALSEGLSSLPLAARLRLLPALTVVRAASACVALRLSASAATVAAVVSAT